jgi:hypothetical protein
MGRNDGGSARQSWPITVVAAAGLAVFALPAFAQHAAFGHASGAHDRDPPHGPGPLHGFADAYRSANGNSSSQFIRSIPPDAFLGAAELCHSALGDPLISP